MKERDLIHISKHVLSCLKIYLSFSKRFLKKSDNAIREGIDSSSITSSRSAENICCALKFVLK